jgi:parvulin-like peptidyl-prolyl isomerase
MHRFSYLLAIVALSAVLAACGGGGSSAKLDASDVAVVGSTHVSAGQFTAMMASAEASYKQQGQAFPKQGTSNYESIKSQAVTLLIQRAEREDEAASEGIVVTAADVQKRLVQIKKQYFKGDEKQYEAQLKKAKLTDATFRDDIKQQLVEEKLYAKITKDVKVTDKQIADYYKAHISSYSQAASRQVEYMLIKKKALADQLYAALKKNPSLWCADAKKYSGDPSSSGNCGKATFTKGSTVAAFDQVLFSQKTGVIHAPVYDKTQYKAYFLIRPLAAVKAGKTSTLAEETKTIKSTLLQQAKSDAINAWSTTITKQFCSGSQIKYQVGYQPSPDPCAATTTSNTTTT